MRFIVRLGLGLALALALVSQAVAGLSESRRWFEALPGPERLETQSDLVLAGHLDALIDGKFSPALYEALVAFQQSLGAAPDGVLRDTDRSALAGLATAATARLRLERVDDVPASLTLELPGLLTVRTPTAYGTSYSTSDGEFSLETMRADIEGDTLSGLYAAVVAAADGRQIFASEFTPDRFLVSGQLGDYAFSTLFIRAGRVAHGYSLAWGRTYADEGRLTAAWLGAHVGADNVLEAGESDPGSTAAITPAVPEPVFRFLPDAPNVILLSGEITHAVTAEFTQVLALRPRARILALDSPGGDVAGALELARTIRKLGSSTVVPEGRGCYSACAYIFFAGMERDAAGELGVHQISTEENDLVFAQSMLGDLLDALGTFGVDQQVISAMLRTPPEDMHVFSKAELDDLGINVGPPIPVTLPAVATPSTAALVELASFASAAAAERSKTWLLTRWTDVLKGAPVEIERDGSLFRVSVPVPGFAEAEALCAAIQEAGGGCFVRPGH